MVDSSCFTDGMGRDRGEETVPGPQDDEVVVFEEFFTAGFEDASAPCAR
jgi:hypothetical protein